MIADYYFIRKQKLITNDLYDHKGIYGYTNGFNITAIIAFIIGVIPVVPGFLVTVKLIDANSVATWLSNLYHYAWFVGFFVSGVVYWGLTKRVKS